MPRMVPISYRPCETQEQIPRDPVQPGAVYAVPADRPDVEFNLRANALMQTQGMDPVTAGREVAKEHPELAKALGLDRFDNPKKE